MNPTSTATVFAADRSRARREPGVGRAELRPPTTLSRRLRHLLDPPPESGEDGGLRSFLSLASWRGFIRRPGPRFAACLARSSADSSRNLAAPAEPEVRSRS
jgi:hypothetical protein